MSGPGFGFSVGDFIAGVKLAKGVVHALNDGAGARPAFRNLTAELRTLLCALKEIRCIEFESLRPSINRALDEASSQCQDVIENFLKKNEKYYLSLGEERRTSRLHAGFHKIQWALGKKEEIEKLRTEILGHTTTINTLLISMQSSAAFLQTELLKDCRRNARNQYYTLFETQEQVKQTNDMLRAQADAISKIINTLEESTNTSQQPNPHEVQCVMVQTLEANMKICKLVTELKKAHQPQQQTSVTLPPQIEGQQPVHFEDAHGRIAPFHIEFINSLDAFQAVMEIRFRHVPGLSKVQRLEYVVREPDSNRLLDLHAPWQSVFLPGRRVTMSMVFWRPLTSMTSCPCCSSDNAEAESDVEVQCANPGCRIWYDHVLQYDTSISPTRTSCTTGILTESWPKQLPPPYEQKLNSNNDDYEDEMHRFRRVQVRHVLNPFKDMTTVA